MTRWFTSKESSQEESLVLALSQVITVEHWGPQVVRISFSLLERVFYLVHAAPLALRNTSLFSDIHILKDTARWFLFAFSLNEN